MNHYKCLDLIKGFVTMWCSDQFGQYPFQFFFYLQKDFIWSTLHNSNRQNIDNSSFHNLNNEKIFSNQLTVTLPISLVSVGVDSVRWGWLVDWLIKMGMIDWLIDWLIKMRMIDWTFVFNVHLLHVGTYFLSWPSLRLGRTLMETKLIIIHYWRNTNKCQSHSQLLQKSSTHFIQISILENLNLKS